MSDTDEARADLGLGRARPSSRLPPALRRGDLFKSYLKQVEACPACGEAWSEVRADDGPAWLTILIVGHLLAPAGPADRAGGSVPTWVLIVAVPRPFGALCLSCCRAEMRRSSSP